MSDNTKVGIASICFGLVILACFTFGVTKIDAYMYTVPTVEQVNIWKADDLRLKKALSKINEQIIWTSEDEEELNILKANK